MYLTETGWDTPHACSARKVAVTPDRTNHWGLSSRPENRLWKQPPQLSVLVLNCGEIASSSV